MQSAPFFIVGSARSGTTLLRVIFNAHPEIAVPPESRFITELATGSESVEPTEFLARLERHRQFQSWGLPTEEIRPRLAGGQPMSYARAIEAVYDAYTERLGKKTWGDKTPRYVENIPFLARLFPESRFIHLVRDGRNVALSYADVPFGPKTVGKAAALWKKRVMAGVDEGRPLGPSRYKELRYEDLVASPESQVRALCDFVGIAFAAEMMEYTDKAQEFVFEKAKSYNPHVLEKPRQDVRSWTQTMPPDHVAVFEAVAGDVLDLFGYERRYPKPGLGTRVAAALGGAGLPVGRLRKVESAG